MFRTIPLFLAFARGNRYDGYDNEARNTRKSTAGFSASSTTEDSKSTTPNPNLIVVQDALTVKARDEASANLIALTTGEISPEMDHALRDASEEKGFSSDDSLVRFLTMYAHFDPSASSLDSMNQTVRGLHTHFFNATGARRDLLGLQDGRGDSLNYTVRPDIQLRGRQIPTTEDTLLVPPLFGSVSELQNAKASQEVRDTWRVISEMADCVQYCPEDMRGDPSCVDQVFPSWRRGWWRSAACGTHCACE